jgi:hypothetical protein
MPVPFEDKMVMSSVDIVLYKTSLDTMHMRQYVSNWEMLYQDRIVSIPISSLYRVISSLINMVILHRFNKLHKDMYRYNTIQQVLQYYNIDPLINNYALIDPSIYNNLKLMRQYDPQIKRIESSPVDNTDTVSFAHVYNLLDTLGVANVWQKNNGVSLSKKISDADKTEFQRVVTGFMYNVLRNAHVM